MIPLALITGFLGSGKTTLMRGLIERSRSRRCVCIINEFGPVDIDGELVELPPEQRVSIPGGSIFCRCLVGEFIRVLRQVSDASVPDGVLIEASGIADPKVIVQMLAETRLDIVYDLRTIVTVVDPGSFSKLVHTLPNIIAQVEASDVVLINKTDLYTAEQVERTIAGVREMNPGARVVCTQYCRVEFDVFAADAVTAKIGGAEPHRSLVGEYAQCVDPNFESRVVNVTCHVERERLVSALTELQPHVYRAKGFVRTPAGVVYVDVSAAGVDCRNDPRSVHSSYQPVDSQAGELVIIAAPAARPHVDAFARSLGVIPELRVL
ncbi:MAG TPA: CobW family GTP-binding protein [Phycisphaerae bacterium]|nr:CobW family GTP-binding protein [Phycisphaerae bacterium]